MRNTLKIDHIDSTISGEGKFAGYPCTIIRLLNCNLSCLYCDWSPQPIDQNNRSEYNIKRVMENVAKLGNKYVLVTGGEPLLQVETIPLVYELVHAGNTVWIETNGSIPIDKDEYRRSWGYCMDIKCPSSGMAHHNKYKNLRNLQAIDEVKFVIGDYNDYLFARGIIKQYPTMASLIFSPCFDVNGNHNGGELAEWMLQDKLTTVRLGLQIHKIIGVI